MFFRFYLDIESSSSENSEGKLEQQEAKQESRKSDEKFKYLINEQINFHHVLLIKEKGDCVEMSISEALKEAKDLKLDLVLISKKTNPPIVKILDYGKFLYQIKRKNKGSKKNVVKVKSITIKPQISEHDIQWKSNQAIEWFKSGDRVQFLVRAPGRMSERIDLINQVFNKFSELVSDYGKPKEELKKISKIQYVTYFFPTKK